jgi:ankyrin repeat protein
MIRRASRFFSAKKLTKDRFRWAQCQIDALEECLDYPELKEALNSLPTTLDETYRRILDTIPDKHKSKAVRILQFLTLSKRPLSIKEIVDAIAVNTTGDPYFDPGNRMPDPQEISRYCSSLVVLVSMKSGAMLQLAHFSVKEYLMSNRVESVVGPEFQEVTASASIARVCLAYLLQFDHEIRPKKVVAEFPLAKYSATFWMSFAAVGDGEEDGLMGLIERFFCFLGAPYKTCYSLNRPDKRYENQEPDDTGTLPSPLYYAALGGLRKTVQLLLERKADVNAQGGRYGNALQAASAKGHKQIVKMLLDNGAEINAQGGEYGNALQAASDGGYEAVVKMLLDMGAKVNAQGGVYGSALQAASAKGYEQIAKILLSAHAAVNMQGGYYTNALHAALKGAHETTVRVLLERGANVGLDVRLKGAIHHAVNSACCIASLVSMLQQYGAPLDTVDVDNMTPLHYCVKFGYKAIARQLINAGVLIDSKVHRQAWPSEVSELTLGQAGSVLPVSGSIARGLTPLHFAALTGNNTMTKFLLEQGADPNALSEYGETPLHLTLRIALFGTKHQDDWDNLYLRAENLLDFSDIDEDDIDAVLAEISLKRKGVFDALLADPRISLTITDYKGESLLHCIRYGKPESATLVQDLMLRGADPFYENLSRQSPLHLASKAGDYASVRTLLHLGAKVALTDEHGLNALHYAAQSGNHETIIAILETEEARTVNLIAMKDKHGQNVLHHMLSTPPRKQVEIVQSLLDRRADSLELDNSGFSPLARFIKKSRLRINIEICRSLLEIKGNASFVDCDGQTLGHLCASTLDFRIHILKVLDEHGVDLAKKDCDGRTVVHRAAICGSLTEQSLGFLINVIGIQADEKDRHGRTALQYAIEQATRYRRPGTFDSTRWERTRAILQKSHADRMHESCLVHVPPCQSEKDRTQ